MTTYPGDNLSTSNPVLDENIRTSFAGVSIDVTSVCNLVYGSEIVQYELALFYSQGGAIEYGAVGPNVPIKHSASCSPPSCA